jgi:hypothetical protein
LLRSASTTLTQKLLVVQQNKSRMVNGTKINSKLFSKKSSKISLTSKSKDSIESVLLKCILKSRSQHISDQKNVQDYKSNKTQSHLFCLPLHFCRNLCDKTKLCNNAINILRLVDI